MKSQIGSQRDVKGKTSRMNTPLLKEKKKERKNNKIKGLKASFMILS